VFAPTSLTEQGTVGPGRSGRATALAGLALVFAAGLAGCDGTADSIGYDKESGGHLRPLAHPATYPNVFRELGHSDVEIANKIAAWFAQLFHGDLGTQAIFFPAGADQASIQDILHNKEIRTEGMGLGMMIAVELDKREEFDRLWTFASTALERTTGAGRGYFQSHCDTPTMTEPCDDPYGEQQMVTALIFAHDRWGSTTTIDYETEALELLDVMRHKEDENNGIVDGVTNTFDASTALPFTVPTEMWAAQGIGRPSIVMPAYYDLWAEATGDAFWTRSAAASRNYWKLAAYPTTGLMPARATFAGEAVPNYDNFLAESYRAQINMALDEIWTTAVPDDWEVSEADRLLKFFTAQGIDDYGATFRPDGTTIDPSHDNALVACNGVTAMIARVSLNRAAFIADVWAVPPPVGVGRYYSGILGLTALLILSGQYIIW
jgi:oligosaccharide reducing-end xylanase